jgi:hypothetical protein
MLASRGAQSVLAVAVAVVTIYAARQLSPWLLAPGAVLFILLVISSTDLIERIAIQRAVRELQRDEGYQRLSEEADQLLAQDTPEEAKATYLAASELRDDRATVIARYVQMARRARGDGEYKEARKWLERAKQATRR